MSPHRETWRTARSLAGACHPVPTVAVTVLATVLAAAVGRDLLGCVLVALAVLSGQLSIGWSNDLLDHSADVAAGRADKPLARVATGGATAPTAHLVSTVRRAALWSAAACVPLSLASGLWPGVAHLVGVAAGWAYNAGLKRTVLSWAAYAVGFGMLVVFVVTGTPTAAPPPWWLVTAGAVIGVGAHFANVLPDLEADAAAGVRGFPQRVGRTGSALACAGCFVLASALLVGGHGLPVGRLVWTCAAVAVVLAVAGAGLAAHIRARWPFILVALAAAANLALLVATSHGAGAG